jgi:hypothetical protein
MTRSAITSSLRPEAASFSKRRTGNQSPFSVPASPLATKLIGQISGSILQDPEILILEVF